ncbi:NAD(P)/FAD-dependent oxidoreductase [Clostridium estertheticum]|uniref:NAD(P)/FAD-dependent oxidoreductase n=1 Tax=Clostridium estertheticum TaxID=238834 RepID=UPI0013E945FC|nr:NAD(P)/FAD-dependent oxidoreductase [Clostridium estertheticum]MBZ9687020.1 NAD(P)/FAD-dependent oxidoreductase [Clostridium estertheticum]
MKKYDVIVLGGGPAGLSAAIASFDKGMNTLIIEREKRLGGILKQCIHDGFGLIEFKEKLTGPEYAEKFIKVVMEKNIPLLLNTFVIGVEKADSGFQLTAVNSKNGVEKIWTRSLILASGCRERTAKQVFINGTRPAGIFSAGTAQHLVNIEGYLPCKNCVILGSGDIGLIMARRLTLEGAKVLGVYEAKSTPSGLSRNIAQCLNDFNIPLHISTTITRVIGDDRVKAVEIARVDDKMKPIKGTEKIIQCDGVILSVGLIPENEIAEMLGVNFDNATKGPVVDQNFMTTVEGVFSCGNALHVNDLVDYVSESGKLAGENAGDYVVGTPARKFIDVKMIGSDFLYVVPQQIDVNSINKDVVLYFRSRDVRDNMKVTIKSGENILFSKRYMKLKPPEMERAHLHLEGDFASGKVEIFMEGF